MKAEQVLVLLWGAGHLNDGDGEAVRGGSEDCRGQRRIVLIQELCMTACKHAPQSNLHYTPH